MTVRSAILAICIGFMGADAIAQGGFQHQPSTLIERNQTEMLEFRTSEVQDNQISEALFFSMTSAAGSYSQREVRVVNGTARIPLLITDESVNDVEYYFVLRLIDGTEISYPNVADGEPPFVVNVVDPEEDREKLPVADFVDYTVLSPVPGQSLSDEDLLIAIALFYDDEDVEDGNFRIMMNGEDVTTQSEISPFVIKFKPQALADGNQSMQILLDRDDTTYEVTSWNFRVMVGEPVTFGAYNQPRRRAPSGNIELGARNQEIAGTNNDALTGRIRLTGQEGDLQYSLDGYLTSQEDSRLQPQNRYSADIRYGRWFQFQAGDVYPFVSDMTISGRRVRGLNTQLSFFREAFELQFLMGQMNRGVNNLYETILAEESDFGTNYVLGFEDGGRGVFKQDLIGGRMSFGRESGLRLSFHGLKIQDDTTSINVIRNFGDVQQINPALASNLSLEDRQYLEQNSGELQIAGSNPRPRGNVVAGSELRFAMNDQRIRFRTEAGISMLNQDISDGFLTQQRADELGIDLDQDIENLFDRLSWLIIINENMSTLPFRFNETSNGDLELDPFFPTAILASDSRLNLNYLGNQLEIRYRWIGPDYQSLANSTIRRDVEGISITDRFRLMQNRFYITLGYENLNDNLLGDRQATTNTTTYSGAVSWFPVRRTLPRVNVSTRFRTRDNSIERFNPVIPGDLMNSAVRNYELLDGQLVTAANPRNRETVSVNTSVTQSFNLFDMNHQAVMSYGVTRTDDKLFDYGDSRSRNFSTRVSTRLDNFNFPVRTRIGFNTNKSESVSGLAAVTINGFDAGIETILMDGSLTLNTDFAITSNSFETLPLTTSEVNGESYYIPAAASELDRRETNAFIFRASAQYDIHRNHAIAATANITNLRVTLGDLGDIPNDRVLHLRYILNF